MDSHVVPGPPQTPAARRHRPFVMENSRRSTADGAAVRRRSRFRATATRAVVPALTQSGVVATALPQRAVALAPGHAQKQTWNGSGGGRARR